MRCECENIKLLTDSDNIVDIVIVRNEKVVPLASRKFEVKLMVHRKVLAVIFDSENQQFTNCEKSTITIDAIRQGEEIILPSDGDMSSTEKVTIDCIKAFIPRNTFQICGALTVAVNEIVMDNNFEGGEKHSWSETYNTDIDFVRQ